MREGEPMKRGMVFANGDLVVSRRGVVRPCFLRHHSSSNILLAGVIRGVISRICRTCLEVMQVEHLV